VHRFRLLLLIALVAAACQGGETEPPTPVTTSSPTTTVAPTTTTTSTTTTTTTLPPTPTTIPAEPAKDASAPRADSAVPAAAKGAAIIARGGADLYRDLEASEPYVRAHEGLLFPVVGQDGEWLELLDHCDDPGWVRFDEVGFTPAQTTAVTPGMAFSDAVIVVDPGHGGPNIGAVGPTGLIEKEVNLDIARRTRDLLNAPHTVDWETGEILDGSAIPPAGQVWLTRPEGPEGADIEAGLTFRTTIADSVNAHALVSIHNNAAPDGPYDGPGSEVYHQVTSTESKRLSGLIVEEMRRGFSLFEADWVGDDDAGAKIRVGENGVDIYGILRLSDVPAVIAEGVYISNPSEEALLATPEFRQAYADAVYRALIRFITTDDGGSGFVEVEPFTAGGLSSGAPVQACTVAAQPDE